MLIFWEILLSNIKILLYKLIISIQFIEKL